MMSKKFETMKHMKRIVMIMVIMAAALVALPAMAQQNNSRYGRPYKPQQTVVSPTATYHSTTFQSTGSTMMNTGSTYSSRPRLNTRGTAVYGGSPRSSVSGPHRGLINHGGEGDPDPGEGGGGGSGEPDPGSGEGGGSGSGIGTPPDDDDDPNGYDSPIGDAVLPLMLLACAYLGMRVYLRRKRA